MQAALLFSDLVPLVKHLVSGRLIFLNNLGILVYLCFPSFHEVFFSHVQVAKKTQETSTEGGLIPMTCWMSPRVLCLEKNTILFLCKAR